MRRACYTLSLIGAWLAMMACTPARRATPPPTAAEPTLDLAPRGTATHTDTNNKPVLDEYLLPPASTAGELLVATASSSCTTRPCVERCCNNCGRVVWKLASDPAAQIVTHKVKLPKVLATECSLHFDLRAQGDRNGDRFIVRAVQTVPSERGRRPGTSAKLEVRPDGGYCTLIGCPPAQRCCNSCGGFTWVPTPTSDAIKWSGKARLPSGGMDCDIFTREVTGTWLGPNEFEINSVHALPNKPSR